MPSYQYLLSLLFYILDCTDWFSVIVTIHNHRVGVLMIVLLQDQWKSYCRTISLLAFQSFGVVYGDLSTSPLYVYKSAFSGRLNNYRDETTIFGLFSLIFWTLTLLPLLKYVIIVLNADDNGEGE